MRVSVLIPLPLTGPYDYLVPEGMALTRGDFVAAPLMSRQVIGVVWQVHEQNTPPEGLDPAKLKKLIDRLDVPPLNDELMAFVDWVASYTMTPPGAVLRLVMRSTSALEPPRMQIAYVLSDTPPPRMTKARQRVLDILRDNLPRTAAELAQEAGTSSAVVKGLAQAGALSPVDRPADRPFPTPDPAFGGVELSPAQAAAAQRLIEAVDARQFSTVLLDGVPGSGKTETYFEAVAAALKQGKQALILLPEIALTVQFLDRFADRFGCRPAAWHSDLTSKERRRTWRAVAQGKVPVLVGARSALFLPFPDLGLIVVDEEHDPAFKQEEGVIYHARDMAVVRGSLGHFPVVLSTATPSLETVVNVAQGRYRHVVLPERHGPANMPQIDAVDMRQDGPERGRWLSPRVIEGLRKTLQSGEQGMLFLNRRGYAPLTLCRKCGHRMKSPDSSSWLVEHRLQNRLVCHHTGFSMAKPKTCPGCGAEDSLVGCGPGVERVAEEAADLFPDATVVIMSSDTVRGPAAVERIVEDMLAGNIDLLIGTQIVAKGYHFPRLTFVGVVDADLGLSGGDLRAAERTFQLLSQVAGRAGRESRPGRVLLQTFMPEHPVMAALIAGGRDGFLAAEAAAREDYALPPFGRLASIILSSRDPHAVEATGRALAKAAPVSEGVSVLGPAPAPFALLRGRHRHRLLVKAERQINLQAYLSAWLAQVKPPNNVRLAVDIDPYSFL